MFEKTVIAEKWRDDPSGPLALFTSAGLVAVVVIMGLIARSGGGGEPPEPVQRVQPLSTVVPIVTPVPTPLPTVPPTPVPTPAPLPPPLGANQRIVIEKIGVNAPTAAYGLDANRVPNVPTGGDASYVVAWYDFSAPPGAGGNAVYAGHVTWNGPAVFYSLSSLAGGDLIRVRDDRGAEVVYQVTGNQQMDPSDPNAINMMYPTDRDVITIITCGGSFYTTSDPVFGGDYSARTIIRGELVSITRV